MLTRLLYDHDKLKSKFCRIMSIPVIPGRIALNSKITSVIKQSEPKKVKQLLSILKPPLQTLSSETLFWFISVDDTLSNESFSVVEVSSETNNTVVNVDPFSCMVGFILKNAEEIPPSLSSFDNSARKIKSISMTENSTNRPFPIQLMTYFSVSEKKNKPEEQRILNLGKLSANNGALKRPSYTHNVSHYERSSKPINHMDRSMQLTDRSEYTERSNLVNRSYIFTERNNAPVTERAPKTEDFRNFIDFHGPNLTQEEQQSQNYNHNQIQQLQNNVKVAQINNGSFENQFFAQRHNNNNNDLFNIGKTPNAARNQYAFRAVPENYLDYRQKTAK